MSFIKGKIRTGAVVFGICTMLVFSGCEDQEIKEQYAAAAAQLEQEDYAGAAVSFTALTETGEMLAESYRGLGLAEFYQGNYAEASIALSKSLLYLETDNKSFEKDVNSYLAMSRMKRQEYEEAVKVYDELIGAYPETEYYYQRGICYIKLEQYDKAKADFDAAAEDSTDSAMFISIYEIYDELQMNADGSEYLEKGLTLVKENDYYSKGLIYYYLQEYSNAKDVLIHAVNEDHNKDAVLLLGKVYLAMEDTASARAVYQEYTEDEEVGAEAYNGLALCDIEVGDYESALNNVQKGLSVADESKKKSLLFNELCIYEYMNDWPTAREKVREYLEKYPDDEAAVREQQFLNH